MDPAGAKLNGLLLLLLVIVLAVIGMTVILLLMIAWRRQLRRLRGPRRRDTPVVDAWKASAQRMKLDEESDDQSPGR